MADYDEMGTGGTVPDLREMLRRLEALQDRFALLSDRAARIQGAENTGDLRHLAKLATQASEQILSVALALSSAQPPELGEKVTREEAWREKAGPQREAVRASLADPKWWHEQIKRFFGWQVKAEIERAEAAAGQSPDDPAADLRRKLDTLTEDLGFFQETLNGASQRVAGCELRMAALEQQVGTACARMDELMAHLKTVRRVGEELRALAGGEI